MKIILNKCFGGFRASVKAHEEYAKRIGKELTWYQIDFDGLLYKLTDPSADDIFAMVSTKDFGGSVNFNNEEFNKHIFALNGEYRTDSILIDVVEKLGEEADSKLSKLTIVDIPDGLKYEIDDYDGWETLREEHRTW